jgi:hypothetical protein
LNWPDRIALFLMLHKVRPVFYRIYQEMTIFDDFVVGRRFNPRNINPVAAAIISARLVRDENISILDGH